jgi:hypothetical protein
VVQLAVEHLAGAILVVVAVLQVGEAAAVVAHLAGEVVPLPEVVHLVGVAMADAQPMAEEMDHGLLMVVVMVLGLLTAEQLLTEGPRLTVERQLTAAMTETVPPMVASTPAVAHLVGVDHQEPLLRNLAVSLLLRLAHTTPQHLVLTQRLLLVAMAHTLPLRQEDHLWMLLHLETTLRLRLVIHRVVDTALRRLHQVRGTLRRQHLVATPGTIRHPVSSVR